MGLTYDNYSSDPSDLSKFYSNGNIPVCELQSAPGVPASVKIHPQAAEQLGKLMLAAQQAGFPFTIISSYRPYSAQVELVGGNPNTIRRGVAQAGHSKHGWGTAIDIGELWNESVRVAKQFAADNRPLPPGSAEAKNRQWDMLDGPVHEEIRRTSRLYKWLDENAPKFGWVNPTWARNGGDYDECWHWEYRVFSANWPRQLPPTVIYPPSRGGITAPCGELSIRDATPPRNPIGSSPVTSSISPYIGSLASFHPNIQYELTKRRISKNTTSVRMPFIKLTSLTQVLKKHLQGGTSATEGIGAYAPSLGPHGQDYIDFNEIYYPQSNRSIVGYCIMEDEITKGTELAKVYNRVPLLVDSADAENLDQSSIPIPGISEASIERSTAGPMGVRGGLVKADLKIIAYSVGQLNTLLTYFLRPATRVVLELGNKSNDPNETITPYAWNKPKDNIQYDFTTLIHNPAAQRDFINEYVYNNFGRYEIFIGYVVKFDLKYTKTNTFEISLTVHSVQQFEIPTVQSGVRSLCPDATSKCRAMDVREYFDASYSWKPNTLTRLLTAEETKAVEAPPPAKSANINNWADHFISIKNSSPGASGGAGAREAGLDENEYFVSWRFFVEKILNDDQLGLISVIQDDNEERTPATATSAPAGSAAATIQASTSAAVESRGDVDAASDISPNMSARDMLRLGLLRPVSPAAESGPTDLIANEVGYHPDLRSTNPEVMLIYNEQAQANRTEDDKQKFTNLITAAITDETQRTQFGQDTRISNFISGSSVGSFSSRVVHKNSRIAGTAFLDTGVWINTKAIKQAFTSAETVTSGIQSLLNMMNAATQGYWNLQLYSTDRLHSGLFIVDMGVSKRLERQTNAQANNSEKQFPWIDEEKQEYGDILDSINKVDIERYRTQDNRPRFIYMFNRKTTLLTDGELGSDIIDLNVEFNLPHVIAVQAIAGVGGSAQKSTLQSININELKQITLIPNLFAKCNEDVICKEEDCGRGDAIDQLKAAFDRVSNDLKALPAPTEFTVPDTTGKSPEEAQRIITEAQEKFTADNQRRTQLESRVASARDAYYSALVQRGYGNANVISTARELSSLGMALNLIEFNRGAMLKKLNLDSMTAEATENNQPAPRRQPPAHAFNSSNLTKTTVNVTIPGIGGIELFQSFVVDRVPSILKRGFYVVTKVAHKFSTSGGWTTSIEGRFRFRPIQEDSGSERDVDPCEASAVTTTTTAAPAVSRPQSGTVARAGAAGSAASTQNFAQRIRGWTDDYLASVREQKTFVLRERGLSSGSGPNRLTRQQDQEQRQQVRTIDTEIRNRIRNYETQRKPIPASLVRIFNLGLFQGY